jgi:hypothetical protein
MPIDNDKFSLKILTLNLGSLNFCQALKLPKPKTPFLCFLVYNYDYMSFLIMQDILFMHVGSYKFWFQNLNLKLVLFPFLSILEVVKP